MQLGKNAKLRGARGENKHGGLILLLQFFNVLCMAVNCEKFQKNQGNYRWIELHQSANIIANISAASISVVSDGESRSFKTAKNSNRKRIFKKNTKFLWKRF